MKISVIIFSLSLVVLSSSAGLNVTQLIGQIRQNTEQKQTQVQDARDFISVYQWFSFNQGVALVCNYQQFVFEEHDKFQELAKQLPDEECLESLPKPVYSILKTADWNIEMCIGHMAVYGSMQVEDVDRQLNGFQVNASMHALNAMKDYFQSADWSSERGVQATTELLTEQMRHWDNVESVDLFNLKNQARNQIQSMVNYEWTLCVNHGKNEIKRLFDAAAAHLKSCAPMQINQ